MGLRMTINSAVAFSLGLLFLALVGCAVVFLAGLVRLMREGRDPLARIRAKGEFRTRFFASLRMTCKEVFRQNVSTWFSRSFVNASS